MQIAAARYTLGIGLSKNGLAGMAGGRIGEGPAGWWLYGDRRTMAGGVSVAIGHDEESPGGEAGGFLYFLCIFTIVFARGCTE